MTDRDDEELEAAVGLKDPVQQTQVQPTTHDQNCNGLTSAVRPKGDRAKELTEVLDVDDGFLSIQTDRKEHLYPMSAQAQFGSHTQQLPGNVEIQAILVISRRSSRDIIRTRRR